MPARTDYNGLKTIERTLPSHCYYDIAHHERELAALWHGNWLYLCRAAALEGSRAFRTFDIGNQSILLLRDDAGELRAFHNTCRHRGSRLCTRTEGRFAAKAITCPYHAWTYDLRGDLVRIPSSTLPEGFDRRDYPLYDVAVEEWRGFVFVHLAGRDAPPFAGAFSRDSVNLDNWPLESLVSGHRYSRTLQCNWKIFWENYAECLHCPGIHPELCELVPLYGRGMIDARDDPDWADRADSDDPRFKGGLRRDAATWSMDGLSQGACFPGLTEAERKAGHTYVTVLPSMFLAAHADYVRVVTLRPLGPERTELRAEWLFPRETLSDHDFNLANVVDFGTLVMEQDTAACELNQRGLRSLRHEAGVLMPEEYYLHRFHDWVRQGLART